MSDDRFDHRFDFGAFDLGQDSAKVDRLVGNVMWRARAELSRRARAQTLTVTEAVAAWFRPAIAAAAAIAGISLTMLATAGSSSADAQTGAYMSSAEIPAAMTSWYEEDLSPTASDLLVATIGDD